MKTIITVTRCNARAYKGAVNLLKFQEKSAVLLAVTAVHKLPNFDRLCPYPATRHGIIIVGIICTFLT